MPRSSNPWLRLGVDAWMLSLDAAQVIALRSAKLAAGGAAGEAEARRMVSEKVEAAQAWQVLALTGGLGFSGPQIARRTLSHYRRKVGANRRRLSRG